MRDRYRRARSFRDLVDACAPRGIPYSVFVGGRPPVAVEWVQGPEQAVEWAQAPDQSWHPIVVPSWHPVVVPLGWSDEDQAIQLAWMAEQAALCKGCGHPLDESSDPSTERDGWDVEPIRCHACATRDTEAKAFVTGTNAGNPSGMYWSVHRA